MKLLMEQWNKYLEEESKDKLDSEVSDAAQAELDAATDLNEDDDRCTRIAKRKYDVWPSAYASGAVVKCRKGKIWKDLKEDEDTNNSEEISLLRQISDKLDTLDDLDTSIDYLASVLSGEDALSVGMRQKMFGRGAQAEPIQMTREDLRKWFARKGEKGSTGGWVDCNAPDGDGGYKQCAQDGRKKKPACRPTPSACKDPGKGTKWGKKSEELSLTEEQVDSIVEDILTQLEEGGQCTGPTQKASSTSKGKKWMQCVKNPDGKGYKRIHWGQKGVRVTGDSGNTKRKKSFRARHGCSDAKPGTPKYMACKDW